MKLSNIKIHSSIAILVLFSFQNAWSQLNLPSSSFGWGDAVQNDNIVQRAMGGISIADYNYYSTNIKNPATYGTTRNVDIRNITLDLGLDIKTQDLKNTTQTTSNLYTNFSYAYLGFPLFKKLGAVIGFQPISLISYQFSKIDTKNPLDTNGVFNVKKGNGGTYQFFGGIGHQLSKNFSYGINVGFLFSNATSNLNIFPSTDANAQKINVSQKVNLQGIQVEYGLLFQKKLKQDKNNGDLDLQIGINGNIPINLAGSTSRLIQNVLIGSDGSPISQDTIAYTSAQSLAINNPTKVGIGALLNKKDKFKIGIELQQTFFNNWNIPFQNQPFNNQYEYKLGMEIIPNNRSTSYFAQIPYRIGTRFGNYFVKNNNQDIFPWSISLGMGLWVRKYSYTFQSTIINLSFEYQRRGNATNNYYENFYNLSIGFSLSDIWFRKQKFY